MGKSIADCFGFFVWEFYQKSKPAFAFNDGANTAILIWPYHQVAFPMSYFQPLVYVPRTVSDARPILDTLAFLSNTFSSSMVRRIAPGEQPDKFFSYT
jgi:hypothetical protein